ncbi:methyltransferase family protein [Mycolicibacillus parakoreensis]
MKMAVSVAIRSVVGIGLFALVLVGAAGGPDYWQAWVFLAVFTLVSVLATVVLGRTDPAALQRRMRAGPRAETRRAQKILVSLLVAAVLATLLLGAIDHRYGWSSVPLAVVLLGDALVAVGLGASMLVVVQNAHAGATVTVDADHRLVTDGLYGWVRHPMYTATVVLMIGVPLALGSWWALAMLPATVAILVLRLRDEERLLSRQLPGYPDYQRQVRYRLVPYLW